VVVVADCFRASKIICVCADLIVATSCQIWPRLWTLSFITIDACEDRVKLGSIFIVCVADEAGPDWSCTFSFTFRFRQTNRAVPLYAAHFAPPSWLSRAPSLNRILQLWTLEPMLSRATRPFTLSLWSRPFTLGQDGPHRNSKSKSVATQRNEPPLVSIRQMTSIEVVVLKIGPICMSVTFDTMVGLTYFLHLHIRRCLLLPGTKLRRLGRCPLYCFLHRADGRK
jgi:hypothetical protein